MMLLTLPATLRLSIVTYWVYITHLSMDYAMFWALIPRIVPDTHSILGVA